jgi:hypothetical protein
MNISQANLYEILDAFQINAKVGTGGVFKILTPIIINNDFISAEVRIQGLYIFESDKNMYAVMHISDLGIIAHASDGVLKKICLIDFADPTAKGYFDSKDFDALLTHLVENKWETDFVVETIAC